jgi:hypothetical protein
MRLPSLRRRTRSRPPGAQGTAAGGVCRRRPGHGSRARAVLALVRRHPSGRAATAGKHRAGLADRAPGLALTGCCSNAASCGRLTRPRDCGAAHHGLWRRARLTFNGREAHEGAFRPTITAISADPDRSPSRPCPLHDWACVEKGERIIDPSNKPTTISDLILVFTIISLRLTRHRQVATDRNRKCARVGNDNEGALQEFAAPVLLLRSQCGMNQR